MPEKDPNTLSLLSVAIMSAMTIFGGALRYTQKLIEGKKFSFREFLFELFSSLFTGLTFYFILIGYKVPELVSVGVSITMSYFGTRGLLIVYKLVEKWSGGDGSKNNL